MRQGGREGEREGERKGGREGERKGGRKEDILSQYCDSHTVVNSSVHVQMYIGSAHLDECICPAHLSQQEGSHLSLDPYDIA